MAGSERETTVSKAAYYAKGRLPKGEMNKTEARYMSGVIEPGLISGEIVWAKFDGIKLRIAPATFLTVDFAVLPADDMILRMVDVKGAAHLVEEDARVKMKVAASLYPFRFFITWPSKQGWQQEEIGR